MVYFVLAFDESYASYATKNISDNIIDIVFKVEIALQSLREVGAPAKYVIIDDGWQSTANMGEKRSDDEVLSDGELSGAQIDGGLAAERILQTNSKDDRGPMSQACNWLLGQGI